MHSKQYNIIVYMSGRTIFAYHKEELAEFLYNSSAIDQMYVSNGVSLMHGQIHVGFLLEHSMKPQPGHTICSWKCHYSIVISRHVTDMRVAFMYLLTGFCRLYLWQVVIQLNLDGMGISRFRSISVAIVTQAN